MVTPDGADDPYADLAVAACGCCRAHARLHRLRALRGAGGTPSPRQLRSAERAARLACEQHPCSCAGRCWDAEPRHPLTALAPLRLQEAPAPHPAGPALGRRLLDYAVAGLAGQAIVTTGRRALGGQTGRSLLVGVVARGLVAGRRLEALAEETRLRAGDVVAEARERNGEQAPPPSTPSPGGVDDHGHAH